MKDLTTNQKLFSDIVMFLETSIEHPYLKTRDVGSFDELAEALNARGHRNSSGQRLTGKGITKFISRMSDEEKREYLPDFMTVTNTIEQRTKNSQRIQRLAFNDGEIVEWQRWHKEYVRRNKDISEMSIWEIMKQKKNT